MKFINRGHELGALQRLYRHHEAALMILYGRRRVGKTTLLSQWIQRRGIRRALFWTATTQTSFVQLRDFSQTLVRFETGSPIAEDFAFRDWEVAFAHLEELARASAEPLVAIIDEFTHLIQSDPPLASLLQRVWDHRLSRLPNLRLILTGSLIGLMERDVLSARAPLYGRATALMKLRPLPFGCLKELFPRWSADERVAVYAICGGIPAYLALFDGAKRFVDGLRDCLEPQSIMVTDPALLLHDQLQGPQVYESILASITSGFHTWGDIAKMSGLGSGSNPSVYMRNLQSLGLIESRDPVLSPPAGRKGRYYIADPFLRFYYRFILPQRTYIQRGEKQAALKPIIADLRGFIGEHVFEELCREWVYAEVEQGTLGFVPEEIGSFWTQTRGQRQTVQLDVVAASRREKRLLVGECKWGAGSVARSLLTDLVERSKRMPEVTAPGWQVQYVLFAREGFTNATRQAAKEIGARLVGLAQLETRLVEFAARPHVALPDDLKF
jgi:hypothetical protein